MYMEENQNCYNPFLNQAGAAVQLPVPAAYTVAKLINYFALYRPALKVLPVNNPAPLAGSSSLA